MVMPWGTRKVLAPHARINRPVSPSISSTGASVSVSVAAGSKPRPGRWNTNTWPLVVDGDTGRFAHLDAGRELGPVLDLFVANGRGAVVAGSP